MRLIIKKYGFFLVSIFFLVGYLIIGSFLVSGKSIENHQGITNDNQVEQNTEHNANNESVPSIPTQTIFALICAGLIGILCIPRNKNKKENFNGIKDSIKDNSNSG